MSSHIATSSAVSAVAADGPRPVEGTPGIERLLAFATERAMLIRARGGPGIASGWHHHGRREVLGHVLRGRIRFEFGPGGREHTDVEEGGYFHVPVGLVHRDVNPDDEPQDMMIAFIGEGPLVVNLDGPEP